MAFLASAGKWMGGMALGMALLGSMTSTAQAAVYPVIQQVGPSTLLTGQQADTSSGAYSESASLVGPAVITGVIWWGYYADGSDLTTDNFIANGLNLTASGLLTRTLYGTVNDGQGGEVDLYEYYLDLHNPALSVHLPGGTGVGSLINDSLDVGWFWQGATDAIDGPRSYALRGYRDQTNTVPEPGSLVLVGLALAGLGVVRARKSRAPH